MVDQAGPHSAAAGSPGDAQDGVATVDEVFAAIRSLSDADFLRLREAARWQLGRGVRGLEPEDLVNEALSRMCAMSRKWPKRAAFLTVVKNVMRSIVDEVRKELESRPEVPEASLDLDDEGSGLIERTEGNEPAAVDVLLHKESAQQLEDRVLDRFRDNPAAQAVVMGLLDGMTAGEIQAACALAPTQYDSARKAIRRARADIIGRWRQP